MSTERLKVQSPLRDLDLEYAWVARERFDRPVVVFLHEGLGSVAMWRDFFRRLCDRLGMRGLVYSRFGYGRSTPLPWQERFPVQYLHQEALDVLPDVLERLGVAGPWLLGHSDGGSIALLAAAHFPDRFAGAVVMAPHIFVEEVSLANIQVARAAYREHGLRARLARYHDDVDSAFYGWNDVWLDPAFRTWNIESEIKPIICPLLAIQGENDEYATLDQLHRLQRRVPHSRLLILPECGHSPHRDQPDAVISAVQDFVRRSSAQVAAIGTEAEANGPGYPGAGSKNRSRG
jgi:pimeloyl-ACP methyl ester carboxylesterase